MSTDLETPQSTELANPEELAASALAEIDSNDLILPIVKLAQSLTREVTEGDAKPGDFINTVTGRNYGQQFELLIATYFKGRFYSPEGSGDAYAAFGPVMPEHWDHPDAGKPFSDIEDTEERFKAAVNSKLREWGSGPPISTTHNYVGYILDQEDDELGRVPVRLSLMRTSSKAAQSLNTLLRLQQAPWSKRFTISAETKNGPKGSYFVVGVKQGRPATEEEQQFAVNLAQDYRSSRVVLAGDDAEPVTPAKPAETGGMGVS